MDIYIYYLIILRIFLKKKKKKAMILFGCLLKDLSKLWSQDRNKLLMMKIFKKILG